MQIQVRINEDGALRNQRHAFSNRFTLVTELLQNARRAGARQIEVLHDPQRQVLRVQDDGRGIIDFQKLLSLHESGWDPTTCEQEHPFGIGFSKCLYATRRCVVSSGRHRVDIDTVHALARAPVEVERLPESDTVPGTQVDLYGVDLPDLADRMHKLCIGFGVPVSFNGRPIERALAESRLPCVSTPIGSVYLAGSEDGRYALGTSVFLQGFCVLRPSWPTADPMNVVHLDARQFMARLPDRDCLIDEDVQRERIAAAVRACWRHVLLRAKAQLSPGEFTSRFYGAMRYWGHLDLLNDLDELPGALCHHITGYPVQSAHTDREFLSPGAAPVSRKDVESGAVQLVVLDDPSDDNAARWMLARAKGWRIFEWMGVHPEHWATRHLRYLEDEPQQVSAEHERLRTQLHGRWIWPAVLLCKRVRVQVGSDEAMVDDAGVCHEGTLYIPDGEASGSPVEQFCSYTDEHDHFHDAERESDCDALAHLLWLHRTVDPLQAMEDLLQPLLLGSYPLLRGRTFQVHVGVGATPGHSVELLPLCSAEADLGAAPGVRDAHR